MADLYTTDTMMAVVRNLFPAPQFLLDRYFPTVQTEESEEIHFDTFDDFRRVAPFVHPLVEGQIVESPGYQTTTFKPPYVKDKRVFDGQKPFRRSAGEVIGGSMSAAAREQANMAADLQDQLNMLTRREEVMAAELLQTGKLVIEGEKYTRQQLDFKRDASLKINAAKLWSDPTSLPLNDLAAVNAVMLPLVGSIATDVIMSPVAWGHFSNNAQVTGRILNWRSVNQEPTLQLRGIDSEGAIPMGTIDNYNIFVYAGWYIDPMTGTTKKIWADDLVLVVSRYIGGVRCYGAIKDTQAGFRAVRYYSKSWIEEDPPLRFIMMQSAPLPVPTRINASGIIDVL
jgi:hypothetical protein